jgi:hypothetical protein
MSHAEVYAAVRQHVPCHHMEWPDDSAPALPWALYHGDSRPFSADDEQVAVRTRWTVELYERSRDKALEKALADTLRERFGVVRRSESYIENDNMLEVIYTFYQIEGEYDG